MAKAAFTPSLPNTSIKVPHGDANEAFKVRPITERQSLKSQGDTAYLSVFETVAASEHKSKTNSTGLECALWVCMEAYDTSMNDGHLSQKTIVIWNETPARKGDQCSPTGVRFR